MLELSLRFKHGCEFNQLSVKYPNVVMAHWCNYRTDFLEVEIRDTEISPQVQRDISRLSRHGFKILRKTPSDRKTQMVSMICAHKQGSTVDDIMEEHGCMVLQPVLYHGGWEHYRLVVLDEERLPEMFPRLEGEGEVEITMKKRMDEEPLRESLVVSTNELLSDLTAKQAEAMLTALEQGYYMFPRKTTFGEISQRRGVPRTTFDEHVRKAENKIMNSIAPYVALYVNKPYR